MIRLLSLPELFTAFSPESLPFDVFTFLARYEDTPGIKIRYIQIAADPEKSRVTCTT